jgi:hypothetical protein
VTGYLDETVALARQWDASRARSQQTDLGLSELGGCRQAIAYTLAGTWASDVTDPWRAIVGTVLHDEWIRNMRKAADPFLEHNLHVTYRGTGGHPDEVDRARNRVAEWKFPRLSTSRLWQDDPEAFAAKRGQAHGYAAGLVEAGILTEDCTVVVAVMPVDGGFDDWWTHEEPFDRTIADSMADRRAEVEELVAAGELVPRDKPFTWCERFCEFFTVCRGASKAPENEPITDPEVSAAVRQYGELLEAIKPLEARKKSLAVEVRGHRGVVGVHDVGDVWRVAMTSPTGEKDVPDVERVLAEYEQKIGPVPTKTVPTSSPSLRVTRVKPPAAKQAATKKESA